MDAAVLVAGVLGVSQQAAQGWVSRAEQLTGPLAPVLDAMAEGVLDESRVKVICDELIDVDDVVAAQVARELVPQVRAGLVEDPCGEAGVRLKRRVRAVLAGVDPDAVRERAEKTRMERCLRRWATEAGREAWFAQLPADQSMRAWAAIDALARQFVAEGRCDTLDEACADALIALLEGQATVTYQVSLGIPTPDSVRVHRRRRRTWSRRRSPRWVATVTPRWRSPVVGTRSPRRCARTGSPPSWRRQSGMVGCGCMRSIPTPGPCSTPTTTSRRPRMSLARRSKKWCGPGTGGVASPGARSTSGSAIWIMCGLGPPDRRPRRI